MSKRLISFFLEEIKSDLEILNFLKDEDYDYEACVFSIEKMNEVDVLETLSENLYYRSQQLFKLCLDKIVILKELSEHLPLQSFGDLSIEQN